MTEEFKAWFSHQPGYEDYRDAFEREYRRQYGQNYYSDNQKTQQQKYQDNQGYDPYKALEIEPGASWEEIEKAYKKMARKYHPDRFQDASDREIATRVMALINASYRFLKEKHGKR